MTNIQSTLSNTISINSFEKGDPIQIFDISMAIPEADVLKELRIIEEELDAMDDVV